ncbi:hypothetical protein N7H64_001871, partial [Campylobacter jejuni]|nr:hypothetical protein [Campylobacter jejuni]
GAAISNEGGKITGSIKVENGATLTSSSGQAISNSGSGSITGGITISGANTKLEGNIVNTDNGSIGGDIKIENGAQVNGGIINEDKGSIAGSIIIGDNSKLDSISNGEGATIGGGITNNGGGTITIDNQGTINKGDNGNHVTNNGNGSIIIEDWLVTSDDSGKLDTIVVGGSNKDNVTADNITIDESNLNLDNLDHISDVISGINSGNVSNI